jgi:N-acetylmuramoyl-L-alanine amidase
VLLLVLPLVAGCLSAAGMGHRAAEVLEHDGGRYVPCKDLAARYGGVFRQEGSTLTLRHRAGRFQMSTGSRRALFGNQVIWLHREPVRLRRKWAISEADADVVVGPLLRPGPALAGARTGLICLDPGHGGRDEGARGKSARPEKELTLDLARRVQHRLQQGGHRVFLTREDDRYVSLEDRSALASRRQADLLLSLHFNQAANPDARGIEVFALTAQGQPSSLDPPGTPVPVSSYRGHRYQEAGTVLAASVHSALAEATKTPDRGLRRARFAVLRDAPCPSSLAECGFLSNGKEAEAIGSEAYMNTLADALAQGIAAYIARVQAAQERREAAPVRLSPPA